MVEFSGRETFGLRKSRSDRVGGSKPSPIGDPVVRECALTGCNRPLAKSGPCSGFEGFASLGPSANGSGDFHSHFFTLTNNLIEQDRRGLCAAAKPRSEFKFSWTSFLQISASSDQKHYREDKLAAILSEKVTEFLLSNVCLLYTSPSPRDS